MTELSADGRFSPPPVELNVLGCHNYFSVMQIFKFRLLNERLQVAYFERSNFSVGMLGVVMLPKFLGSRPINQTFRFFCLF